MKKKIVCLTLASILAFSTLAGCGKTETGNTTSGSNDTNVTQPADNGGTDGGEGGNAGNVADEEANKQLAEEAELVTGGAVLNIYCWNEEFKSRLTDHYSKYEEVDATHGKIGDVDVVWTITPSTDNAYQNKLDEDLLAQDTAAADSKIDLFLVEADYALKYVDTDATLPVAALGITPDEYADQYKYTQDIVTDSNGILKGVSWQGCPSIMFYNREAAKEVLGSDDPDTVQAAVKDWDTFYATAATMKEAGYYMTATQNDTYRVYSNNVSVPWVKDGKLMIDSNLESWAKKAKEMVDNKYCQVGDLWGTEWSAGFMPEGKVFCYFGPAWLINFCMSADVDGSIANQGGWGGCVGPQSSFWGGTWICAATGSDNMDIVADIMRELTMNAVVMTEIVTADDDFVNNKPAMEAMAKPDSGYASSVMGGQNPLQMYCDGAAKIDLSNLSAYDQGCNEAFQKAMTDYMNDNADYDTAIANFKADVAIKYPELTVD